MGEQVSFNSAGREMLLPFEESHASCFILFPVFMLRWAKLTSCCDVA